MLICPDWNRPLIVESLTAPMVAKHFWTFSGPLLDYVLSPILYLEETTGPVVTVRINDVEFDVPTSWFVMVCDDNTYQLDTVPIATCASHACFAATMSPDDSRVRRYEVIVVDFKAEGVCVHPSMNKHHLMQHPIGVVREAARTAVVTVSMGPHDLHKYLNGYSMGDLV